MNTMHHQVENHFPFSFPLKNYSFQVVYAEYYFLKGGKKKKKKRGVGGRKEGERMGVMTL